MKFEQSMLPRVSMVAGLLVVLAIYSLAWTGTLHFDDEPNLNGLYGISDWPSALRFVVSGESGPTGRPLSLATFALQHGAWPDPKPFLIFNTGLHLFNAILCFLLVGRLLRWVLPDDRVAEWLAVAVALLWAASPFLASSSLMVVQRMTGLSAFFVLLFLVFYTHLRSGYQRESLRSNLLLASTVGAGTLLAGFSKENGFLLPVFVLLIEWLIVPVAGGKLQRLARSFFVIVLAAPAVAIVAYLAYRGFSPSGYQFRDFTLLERLLTQPVALMDYLCLLIIPDPDAMTPFHDSFPVSSGLLSPPATLLALAGMLALLGLTWRVRHSFPLIAFGVLWFSAGHVVESTTLPLELYFPHRNYLPAIGLYVALICVGCELFQRFDISRSIAISAVAGYFFVFSTVLAYGTSLWGSHRLASEMWYIHNRDSVRAAIYLFQSYAENDDGGVAGQLNKNFIEKHPGKAIFSLQSLSICDWEEAPFAKRMERATRDLRGEPVMTKSLSNAIQRYAEYAGNSDCPHFGIEEAEQLVLAASENQNRPFHPVSRQELLFARAQIAAYRGKYDKAINALQQAIAIEPHLGAVVAIANSHVLNGDREVAADYLEENIDEPPVAYFQRRVWRSRLQQALDKLR